MLYINNYTRKIYVSRYNFIHNFINTPGVYKIIQFLMSGTLIEKNYKYKNFKYKIKG